MEGGLVAAATGMVVGAASGAPARGPLPGSPVWLGPCTPGSGRPPPAAASWGTPSTTGSGSNVSSSAATASVPASGSGSTEVAADAEAAARANCGYVTQVSARDGRRSSSATFDATTYTPTGAGPASA